MAKTLDKRKFSIDIDHSLCGNCGACVAVCPEYVLHLGSVQLQSDDSECIGCKNCIVICPADALTLHKLSGDIDE